MIRLKHILATIPAVTLLATAACKRDPNQTKMQYVPDMADTAALKSQRDYLQPPEGSVALSAKSYKAVLMKGPAGAEDFPRPYPATIEEAEKTLQNPVPATPEALAQGKALWGKFCITCHGADGAGDGSITDIYPKPPNLIAKDYPARKDGFYFHKMTFGGAIMPSYGHAISAEERWMIAHYIHELQKAAQ